MRLLAEPQDTDLSQLAESQPAPSERAPLIALALVAPLLSYRLAEEVAVHHLSLDLLYAHTLPPLIMIATALAVWRLVPQLPGKARRGGALSLALATGLLLGALAALINLLATLAANRGLPANMGRQLYFAFHLVSIVPIAEELAFRGLLYRGLRQIVGIWSSSLVTAAIFAMMHAGLEPMVWTFALGLLLAFAYEQTGSVVSPVVIHMLFNTVPVSVALAKTRPFADVSPLWFVAAILALVFAAAAKSVEQARC